MASNVQLNSGADGSIAATKQRVHDGDTTQVQVISVAGVTGTEDSYTHTDVAAGGGVEAAALRVTIANDSTGVLSAISTSVTPGTSAGHLGKAVDSVAGGSDTGVALLAVRDDTLAALTPADGDYTHLRVDSTGALHVRLSSGGMQAIADDAAFTPGTSEVLPVGFTVDETSTDSADEGDIGAARMTADRKQIVTLYAHAAGGATPYKNLDVDETEDQIKASAGKIFWLHAMNLAATKRYLKFYDDTAANVTVGTTVPVLTLPLPTMGDTNGAGFTINFGDLGTQFSTAITVAATTGFADADTGAPGANEVILNLGYI